MIRQLYIHHGVRVSSSQFCSLAQHMDVLVGEWNAWKDQEGFAYRVITACNIVCSILVASCFVRT